MTVIDWQAEVDKRRNTKDGQAASETARPTAPPQTDAEIIPGVPAEEASFLPNKPLEVEARAREIVADIFHRAMVKSPAGHMTRLPPRKG
ncbi:MAG: DNA-directed RNA polymerase I subunit RPA49 family protein [Alphaproteobacteria bacterium]|nr:DNA-directed RNA polymerase I subunit RPA49 family protein [Alphaproteobacteria bacterium]